MEYTYLTSDTLKRFLMSCSYSPFKYGDPECIAIIINSVVDAVLAIADAPFMEDKCTFGIELRDTFDAHNDLVDALCAAKFDMLNGALVMYFPQFNWAG